LPIYVSHNLGTRRFQIQLRLLKDNIILNMPASNIGVVGAISGYKVKRTGIVSCGLVIRNHSIHRVEERFAAL